MIDPQSTEKALQKHFETVSEDEFSEKVDKYCDVKKKQNNKKEVNDSNLQLFPTTSAELELNAYLACALSGLDRDQRNLMFTLSDIASTICTSHGIELYEPRKKTDPVHNPDVADNEVFRIDREKVLQSDLLIFLGHFPSTGAGEELDFALNSLLPIIIIYHSETYVSRMITGIPAFKIEIEYSEPEDFRRQLDDSILKIKPILEERKLAFSEYNKNIVGERIRILREDLGLTREQVVSSIPGMTIENLIYTEENSDRLSNPNLLHLRQIATVLKTTVGELVEPDLNNKVINLLNDWMSGKIDIAARQGISKNDMNKIIRRLLYRICDSLED